MAQPLARQSSLASITLGRYQLAVVLLAVLSSFLIAAWTVCSGALVISPHLRAIARDNAAQALAGRSGPGKDGDPRPGALWPITSPSPLRVERPVAVTPAPAAAAAAGIPDVGDKLRFDAKLLRPGTFAYLVMGEGVIDKSWVQMTGSTSVHVFFLSYRARCREAETPRFHTAHFPHSTWASGRNKLLAMAKEQERRQAWSFEYWMFCDDDVRLIARANVTAFDADSNGRAHARLRALLLRDRPARAGLEFPGYRDYIASYPTACVRSCGYDAALDVFHRTAVDYLLPYTQAFDTFNWWMSSETSAYRSAAMFSPFCNNYREIVHDPDVNQHRDYPAAAKFKEKAFAAYQWCLARMAVSPATWENLYAYGTQRPAIPGEELCTNYSRPVDYGSVVTAEMKRIALCTTLTLKNAYPKALQRIGQQPPQQQPPQQQPQQQPRSLPSKSQRKQSARKRADSSQHRNPP